MFIFLICIQALHSSHYTHINLCSSSTFTCAFYSIFILCFMFSIHLVACSLLLLSNSLHSFFSIGNFMFSCAPSTYDYCIPMLCMHIVCFYFFIFFLVFEFFNFWLLVSFASFWFVFPFQLLNPISRN